VEVLSFVFRPENEEKSDTPPTDAEKARAERAYDLLQTWKLLPGTQADGTIQGAELARWVEEAQRLSKAAHHGGIGDDKIGTMLSHAPKGADGFWPCEAVRDVLEKDGSEEIDDGFCTGVYNNRGVTSRGLRDGGVKERELAQHYQEQSDALSGKWPRTAGLLRRLASGYEGDALREDQEVRRRNL